MQTLKDLYSITQAIYVYLMLYAALHLLNDLYCVLRLSN